jgi:hypothetical protein
MTRMLDILEDYCHWRDWMYCRIDGSTSGEVRDEAMENFNAKGSPIFLFMLSTRAGGLGINLATADTVIIFDSDWNPQMDLQAMDRAHRIGQTKPVVVYRFITEGTVEEKIVERAQRKLYLDAAVIQQGRLAEQSKALSKDEILGMVRFGADAVFSATGSEMTEEDIDALIARGEERTKKDNEKIKKASSSLANFSLGGEEKSLYEFEGKNVSDKGKGNKSWSISLPKRVTKQSNYDENDMYRRMSHDKGAPKPPKPLSVQDFQFFDSIRLEELRQIEMRHCAPSSSNLHTTTSRRSHAWRSCNLRSTSCRSCASLVPRLMPLTRARLRRVCTDEYRKALYDRRCVREARRTTHTPPVPATAVRFVQHASRASPAADCRATPVADRPAWPAAHMSRCIRVRAAVTPLTTTARRSRHSSRWPHLSPQRRSTSASSCSRRDSARGRARTSPILCVGSRSLDATTSPRCVQSGSCAHGAAHISSHALFSNNGPQTTLTCARREPTVRRWRPTWRVRLCARSPSTP